MRMPSQFASDLLATAMYGGNSLLLVQASGGNNSVKSSAEDVLWIKASGRRLAEVSTKKGGIASLRLSALKELVEQDSTKPKPDGAESRRIFHENAVKQIQAAMLNPGQGRASMETGFHSLLGDVVLHLHPVYLNAFACMEGGRELLVDIAPQKFTWIDYVAPGQELAVRINQSLKAVTDGDFDCLVLENHGFIASGQSAKQVIAATEQFLNMAQTFFGDLAPDLMVPRPPGNTNQEAAKKLSSLYRERWRDAQVVIRPARFGVFNQLDNQGHLFETPGALVPDDVVYGGGEIRSSSLLRPKHVNQRPSRIQPTNWQWRSKDRELVFLPRSESLATAMEEMLLAHTSHTHACCPSWFCADNAPARSGISPVDGKRKIPRGDAGAGSFVNADHCSHVRNRFTLSSGGIPRSEAAYRSRWQDHARSCHRHVPGREGFPVYQYEIGAGGNAAAFCVAKADALRPDRGDRCAQAGACACCLAGIGIR